MNWVFETYSNVYSTAMMQNTRPAKASVAKTVKAVSTIARLFGRG